MTSYTSGLRLTNQDNGSNPNTWGDIADANFEFLDDAITGIVSIDITTSSHTLTNNNGSDDEARNALIKIGGTPSSANSIIVPASEKIYAFHATHTSVAGGITLRTAAGTGHTVYNGDKGFIYCDGVSVLSLFGSYLDEDKNLSDLTNVSAALSVLGVTPGTDVQAQSSALQGISDLTTSGNQMLYTTTASTYAATDLTAFARTILDDANASAVRSTLGTTVLQKTHTITGAVSTGTAIIDYDDSIPQITSGTLFMSCSITPVASASSTLEVQVVFNFAQTGATSNTIVALFRDSSANAIAAAAVQNPAGNSPNQISFVHHITDDFTTSVTFTVRGGPGNAETLTFNGTGGNRRFGGVMPSTITITEYI